MSGRGRHVDERIAMPFRSNFSADEDKDDDNDDDNNDEDDDDNTMT